MVGWLLVLRGAGSVIGWLLLANWAVLVTAGFASTYAGFAYGTGRDLPGARAAAIFDTTVGRCCSRRWSPSPSWCRTAPALAALASRRPARRRSSSRSPLVGGLTSHRALDPPFDDVRPWGLLPDAVAGRSARGPGRDGRDPAAGGHVPRGPLSACRPHRARAAEVDRPVRAAAPGRDHRPVHSTPPATRRGL